MSWYEALSAEDREALRPRFLSRSYRRGDVLVEQGDPNTNVYLLDAGHVAIRVVNGRGESVTTTVLGPGSGFGEVAHLTDEETRSASVVALDAVTVRLLPGRVFAELRGRVPEVSAALAQNLATRLRDLSNRFSEIAFESVQRRCGRRLVELADTFAVAGSRSATIPLTQDDLAGLIGASRPTVNQAVGQLAEGGFIALRRGAIDVPDRRRLAAYVR